MVTDLLIAYAASCGVILGGAILFWGVSLYLKNAAIVDILWGLAFVAVAWTLFAFVPDADPVRKWIITILVTVWGVRLALHILWRAWGKPEDYRYQAFREKADASWWWRSLFKVFLLQGALVLIVSIALVPSYAQASIPWLEFVQYIGIAVWAIGFMFEAGGDLQLALFKRNPANRGKVMRSGFWRYTRHPNYFGDAVQWWGYYLIALTAPWGFATILGPAVMTFLLTRVSGVRMLERGLSDTKPEYADYIRRTSPFFPRPLKKD